MAALSSAGDRVGQGQVVGGLLEPGPLLGCIGHRAVALPGPSRRPALGVTALVHSTVSEPLVEIGEATVYGPLVQFREETVDGPRVVVVIGEATVDGPRVVVVIGEATVDRPRVVVVIGEATVDGRRVVVVIGEAAVGWRRVVVVIREVGVGAVLVVEAGDTGVRGPRLQAGVGDALRGLACAAA
ncbi:hypothetical protein [Allorhizocola rhizosphaerae]|uniref:hypothetical protein n=1 Tax=Allorhizocola rhizosphaerae TaxID=1872709 RepID=UPI000E3E03AE|nr:hypothetical protein [Allorhizocola rhizosphaerae]